MSAESRPAATPAAGDAGRGVAGPTPGAPPPRARSYPVSALVMLPLDALWLGVLAPPLYQRTIGPLLRPEPDWLAAAIFYLVYLVGVNEFAIRARPAGAPFRSVFARGALLGAFAYGTFDLTAQAVLAGWSPLVTVVDIAWGALLTATVAAVAHRRAGGTTAAR